MTPDGRQDLAAVIAEMRAKAPLIASDRYGNVRAIRTLIVTWADRLALLLAEAQRPQVQENQEVARVDATGNSKDNPTASENQAKDATVAGGLNRADE